MTFMVSFMLCFLNEDIAFWAFDRIFLNLLPENFLKEDYFNSEKKILIDIANSLKIFKDVQVETHEKFVRMCIELFSKSLFVDILTFQTTYFIWDSMLSKGTVIYYTFFIF